MLKLPRPSLVRVLLLLGVVAAGYLIFSAVGDTLLSQRLTQNEQHVRGQIDQLSQQQKDLQNLRAYLQTDDYVEGVARRVLGLVRPGQTLYIINSDADPTANATEGGGVKATPEPWWERLYRR